jgi:hypothetical protein
MLLLAFSHRRRALKQRAFVLSHLYDRTLCAMSSAFRAKSFRSPVATRVTVSLRVHARAGISTHAIAAWPHGRRRILSVVDCIERDALVLNPLSSLGTPAVFVGGSGYGKESADTMSASIANLLRR